MPTLVILPNPPDFTIVEANDAFYTLTDTRPEDLVYKSIFSAFPRNPNLVPVSGDLDLAHVLTQILLEKKEIRLNVTRFDVFNKESESF